MIQKTLHRLQLLSAKINTGEPLSRDEERAFDALKDEYGVTANGNVKTLVALSRILGKSRRAITKWKSEPDFPVEADGTYDPERIAIWKGLGLEEPEETGGPVSEKVKWETTFRKYRAKLAEVAYRKERGDLIERKAVEKLLIDRAVEFKKALMGRGRRLSLRMANKSAKRIQDIIESDSLQILENYSRENKLTGKVKTRGAKKNGQKKRS